LVQAISEAVSEQPGDNTGFGKAVYYTIMTNSGVNLVLGFAGIALGVFFMLLEWVKKCKNPKGKTQSKELNQQESRNESNSQISLNQKPYPTITLSNYVESFQIKEDEAASKDQPTQDVSGIHLLKFISKKKRISRATEEHDYSRRRTFAQAAQISLNWELRINHNRSPSRMIGEDADRSARPSQTSFIRTSRRINRSTSRIIGQDVSTSTRPSQTSFIRGTRRMTEAPRRDPRSRSKIIGQEVKLNFIQESQE